MSFDCLTLKQLIRIKHVFQHGQAHRIKKTDLGNMLATHHYFWSVEMLLKLLVDRYNVKMRFRDNFDVIWNAVDSQFCKEHNKNLPIKSQVDKVRFARNQVQHSGSTTASSDTENYEGIARSFLEDVIRIVYDKSFDEIEISSLLDENELKKLVNSAEVHMRQKNYNKAIRKLKKAFRKGFEEIKKKYVSEFREIIPDTSRLWPGEGDEKIIDILEDIKSFTLLQAVKVDLKDYAKFSHIASTIGIVSLDDPSKVSTASEEETNFCYSFVTDLLLEWQETF